MWAARAFTEAECEAGMQRGAWEERLTSMMGSKMTKVENKSGEGQKLP